MALATLQAKITSQASLKSGTAVQKLALFNSDGTPFVPATDLKTKAQIIDLGTVTAANATAAAGANPTKAEYDVVVALVNELKGDLNALVAAIKA